MKAAERQLRIRQILEKQDFVDLETLVRALDGSESSLRRDLTTLEQEGLLKRVHGGAIALTPSENHLLDYAWQRTRHAAEKSRIAQVAASLVEDGQTVILDGGSTVAAVAELLVTRSINVITNSMAIAQILKNARSVELTLTGGFLYPRLEVMLGPVCEHSLSGVSADLLIMGTGGVTARGFSNNNTLVVGSERKMIEVSRSVMIIADHSKFGRDAMVHLAPLSAAETVVSDEGLEPQYRDLLAGAGVEVLTA